MSVTAQHKPNLQCMYNIKVSFMTGTKKTNDNKKCLTLHCFFVLSRRKNSPDELPFPITDELIKLPGYKPKMPPLVSSFVDTNSPQTPPVLPPKINNIQYGL